jgi:D-amino peptidase
MKIYMMTDLEVPAGVNRWIQTREGETPEKAAAMRLLTGEVNAAVDGILDADPEAEVIVFDGHGTGGLVFEAVHPRTQVIMHGAGMKVAHHLDASYDALFFVGQHAMANTPDAPLCHSYSSRTVEYYKLNGELIGEIGCLAAIAGEMGVPTAFLSGDEKACVEARLLVPDMVTVETKKGLGIELALHLPAEHARQAIQEGAVRAVRSLKQIAPLRIDPPYELEIRVQEDRSIEGYLKRGMEQLDARTVVKRGPDLLALFQ